MKRRGRGLVENEEQGKNKKMKSIVVEEQDQKEGSEAETGKSEEQDENKKMKSIVVEEQEQKEGSEAETGKSEEEDENKKMKSIVVEEQEQEQEQEEGSESGFVRNLYPDVLYNVLKHVDIITLGRAVCVNRLWNKVAWDDRLWEPFIIRKYMNSGRLEQIDKYKDLLKRRRVRRDYRCEFFAQVAEPPPVDFYLINPQVFSRQIRPWRYNKDEISFSFPIPRK